MIEQVPEDRKIVGGFDAGHRLLYCELCNAVYGSGDMFWEHRAASDFETARTLDEDGEFVGKRELTSGDEIPGKVAEHVPCTPTGHRGDGR